MQIGLAAFWSGAALCPATPVEADTAYAVCREPGEAAALRAGYTAYDEAAAEGYGGAIDRENWLLDVELDTGGGWYTGGAYRGTLLDEEAVDLQTNGYLHSFYFLLHRLRSRGQPLRVSVAPALSASSNVASDLSEAEGDAWQLSFAAVWRFPAGDAIAWRAGLCADHRFGRYRLYPVVAADWRPHPDWEISAGFPDTSVTYRASRAVSATLAAYPNGNEWFVKDKSLTRSSLLEYRAWAVDLAVEWRLTERLGLTAVLGQDFDAEYRADLQDDTRATIETGSTARLGVSVSWSF
jgi:Domain of unknown function (DUF6268)